MIDFIKDQIKSTSAALDNVQYIIEESDDGLMMTIREKYADDAERALRGILGVQIDDVQWLGTDQRGDDINRIYFNI